MDWFGFLNLNKPRGPSSFDLIRPLRRLLGRGVKIGHAGTLDPLASGVLIVCLGPATRLVELVQAGDKEYVTLARLGATSTTDDSEGDISPTAGAPASAAADGPVGDAPSRQAVEQAARAFVGIIDQVPPAYSAVLVGGRRAYDLARAGRTVKLTPRPVTVHELRVLEYAWPELRLAVRCGSGTYIRSLVRDIGQRLGVGGYCLEIRRTRVGLFRLEDAVTPDSLTVEELERRLIDPVIVIPHAGRLAVTDDQARQLTLGQPIKCDLPKPARTAPALAAITPAGRLLGLLRYEPRRGLLWPERMLLR